ncbi:MAG: aminopeptidase [Planctomycetota bacterium]|jgi:aminopeptidase
MADPRVQKLAKLLIEYSLKIRTGDVLLIRGSAPAAPLIREAYRAALRRGALVEMRIGIEGMEEIFFAEASPAQLQWVSPTARYQIKRIDAMLGIWADSNTRSLTNADPKRMAATAKAHKPLTKMFLDRAAKGELKWVGTQWPTNAHAQDAEMSLAEYEEFVFSAGHLDDRDPIATWKGISRSQQALTRALNRTKQIRVVAGDTDLTLSCAGRKWINCDGHENFPDGEVFTGPVERSANGHIRFSFPAVRHGREVTDVFLEFKDGKVVRAEADKGADFLKAMVAMDKGSCYLGEAAFGTNYNITRYTRNTLFDEKIGGTVHLALGAGYPETGSRNQSGLHWDMVCDLRRGGKVYADGVLIQRNGRFVDRRFPQPKRARRK